MAGFRAEDRDGGETREPLDAAAREELRERWSAPTARIERGADGRMRIRVGVNARGRRDDAGG